MRFSLLEILKGSFNDLRRFPVMLIPLLAASIVLFFLLSLLAGTGVITSETQFDFGDPTKIVFLVVTIIVTLTVEFLAFGILVCLAYDAVINRIGDLANSLNRFKEHFRPLLIILLIYAIGTAAFIAVVYTLTMTLAPNAAAAAFPPLMLVLALFLMPMALFALVAAVYDGSGALDSIRSAFALIVSNLASVILFTLTMFLIFLVLGFFSSMLALMPIVGNIISSLILAAYWSIAMDAALRVYRELTNP